MGLRISYFSWVRERMEAAEERIELPQRVATIAHLIAWLAARDARGARAFGDPDRIRAAVDGMIAGKDVPIGTAAEVSLFPPVTGG